MALRAFAVLLVELRLTVESQLFREVALDAGEHPQGEEQQDGADEDHHHEVAGVPERRLEGQAPDKATALTSGSRS